jgi:hypothetical protein
MDSPYGSGMRRNVGNVNENVDFGEEPNHGNQTFFGID